MSLKIYFATAVTGLSFICSTYATTNATCESAYKKGLKSPSVNIVLKAADVCNKAKLSICDAVVERNSDGPSTGDGVLVAAICELNAAYGANKKVNNGKASKICKSSFMKASKSPYYSEVIMAANVCNMEKLIACRAMVETESDGPETGDGKWVAAACDLTAAYGAYSEVKKIK